LLRRHWRKGLASEGARELLRYAFEDMGLARVFAETMAVNEASRATMRSIGMTFTRAFEFAGAGEVIPGSEFGEVEYAIARHEWQSVVHSPRATGHGVLAGG